MVCPPRIRISFLPEVSFLEREGPHPCFSTPVYRGGQAERGRPSRAGGTQTWGSQQGRPASPPKVAEARRIPRKPCGPSDLSPTIVFQGGWAKGSPAPEMAEEFAPRPWSQLLDRSVGTLERCRLRRTATVGSRPCEGRRPGSSGPTTSPGTDQSRARAKGWEWGVELSREGREQRTWV